MIQLSEEQQERIDLIKHKLKFIEQKPAVACVTHFDALTLAGRSVAELISIAGGANENQFHYPDILIVMPAGNTIAQTMQQTEGILQLPNFNELKAVKSNRVYIADGNFDITDAEQLVTLTEVFGV